MGCNRARRCQTTPFSTTTAATHHSHRVPDGTHRCCIRTPFQPSLSYLPTQAAVSIHSLTWHLAPACCPTCHGRGRATRERGHGVTEQRNLSRGRPWWHEFVSREGPLVGRQPSEATVLKPMPGSSSPQKEPNACGDGDGGLSVDGREAAVLGLAVSDGEVRRTHQATPPWQATGVYSTLARGGTGT